MPSKNRKINSFADAQRLMGVIIAEINKSPELAIAAAANPLFALEELGYEISPEARADIQDRIRFGAEKANRLMELRTKIFEIAGERFELESDDALRSVLQRLKLPIKEPTTRAYDSERGKVKTIGNLERRPQVGWVAQTSDPLEDIWGTHPIVEPLLEYRRIEAGEPRLAPRTLYDEIRQGKRRTPLVSVRGVLKR